jgi:hypothetical protein
VTDRILFSSTPDGYREPTHLTCRAPEDWSAVFARYGFVRAFDTDAGFVAPWAVVYERRELTPYQLVLEYDKPYARLLAEVRELRAAVIELDKKAAQSGDAALHERIATLRLELMAARDQAVGALAERDAALARRSDESRQVAERTRARTEAEVEARVHRSDVWRMGSQLNRVVKRAGRVRRALRRSGDTS